MQRRNVFLYSGRMLTVVLSMLFIFHILMLAGALPSDMVWGGTAAGSQSDLLVMETVSLVVTLLFTVLAAGRCGIIRLPVKTAVLKAGIWIMVIYFLLNLAGNIAAESSVERAVFIPVSLILAVLSGIAALTGKE